MQNYFELLSLKAIFSIDKAKLEKHYQQLITQHHPDKFAHKGKNQQAQALQNTALINTAYQSLSDDLNRAKYLLSLSGIDAFDHKDTQMDTDFLIQQIQYRETLEQLEQDKNIDEIEVFINKMTALEKSHIADISTQFEHQNLDNVRNLVRQLRFYQQLKAQANILLDQ